MASLFCPCSSPLHLCWHTSMICVSRGTDYLGGQFTREFIIRCNRNLYSRTSKGPRRSDSLSKGVKLPPPHKALKKPEIFVEAVTTVMAQVGWIKVFGKGTKLIVTPPDKKLDGDFSPKPTIFLPSIAETKLHKAGTYLCLLEKFFPDVIKVYWKEKTGDTILESQEGNTMKTNSTYMKFSWLTVPQKSFDKEHRCIVEHENTRGSKQEILFPAINKGTVLGAVDKKRKPSSLGSENRTVLGTTDMEGKPDHLGYAKDVLRLQLTNSSVYYTYLLLLLKSSVYLAIVTFSLFRRTAVCSAEKSS